jgi:DNA-binding transcriptional regulator YiaG
MAGGAVREWIWTGNDIQARKTNPLLHGDGLDRVTPSQLTGAQIRAARGLLNWSVRDLSEASGVSPSVIRRLEEFNSEPSSPEPRMQELRGAFEQNGVEFLFPSVGKPAVRFG